jgi:hypothetical protein
VREHARRLREEAQRVRRESSAPGPGGPGDRIREEAGARFHAGEQDWTGWIPGPGWTDWPGRRGWEEWARIRGRRGWTGALDFGTFRDLERVAVQFTSDLRKLAMQSSVVGENVISDLRVILEEALDRVKTEIFGPGSETPGRHDTDQASGQHDAPDQPDAPDQHDTTGQHEAAGQHETAGQGDTAAQGATAGQGEAADAPGPDTPDIPGQPAGGTEDSSA